MKNNRKLSRLAVMAVALLLCPASIGFGGPQGQDPKASAQPKSPEPDYEDSCQFASLSGDKINACYRILMNAYACAIVEGGEAEKKAKDNLEQFYKYLHNNTTVGIEKVYNKAKELGCKKESLIPNP